MFESIVRNSPVGVLVVDDLGNVVFNNPSAGEILPRNGRGAVGSHISTVVPDLSMREGRLVFTDLKPGCTRAEVTLPSVQAGIGHYDVHLSQFVDETGMTRNIVELCDVTSRAHAEAAITDQEKRWNLALQGGQIGVFESDLRTGTGIASDTWHDMLGVTQSEGLNSDEEWRARVHPDDLASALETDAQCIEGRTDKAEAKYRMRVGDGTWHWMRSTLRVIERDREGKAVRLLGTMIDITPLESALELAEAREKELEMVIANAPVAMAVLRLDGTFLLLNDACYTFLGYPPAALEGRRLWSLSNTEMLIEMQHEIEGLLKGRVGTYTAEKSYVRPDGSRVDFVVGISRINGKARDGARLIVQIIDITEQKRLAALKDDFVATVSHELRTPLAALHGALGLLNGTAILGASEQVRKLANVAYRSSRRLIGIVDDLLDFQALNTGHLSVRLAEVNIAQLVGQIVGETESYAEAFKVCFALDMQDRDMVVTADPLRLKQVIANLLSNAAKFSPPGATVLVSVKDEGQACNVSITDQGRGISSEFHDRIFQPFSQQAEHSTRDREGSGLGLAISKGLMTRMSGEIGYDSEPNVRTTFWIRIPLCAQPKRRPGAAMELSSDAALD